MVRTGHVEPRYLNVWSLGVRDRARTKWKLMADRTARGAERGWMWPLA